MRVAFHCAAGPTVGVGHVMRCIALAEELAGRGVRPVFACDVADVPWARSQLDRRGFEVVPPTEIGHADAVVLDSYLLPPDVSRTLRGVGMPVLAIVDGDLRGQDADLYVDQNLGAELVDVALPPHARRLAGLDHVMLRDETLAARPAEPRVDADVDVPEVFAFFGGTDAYGAAPVLAHALAATGLPFTATVVAANADLTAALAGVPLATGQWLVPVPPTERLPQLVADADLVMSAAGTSAWELLCLGAAAAVVQVADNQRIGYEGTVATGAVAGLGVLDDIRADPAVATDVLAGLLTSSTERSALRKRAWHLVDGGGRRRVADAFLDLVAQRSR